MTQTEERRAFELVAEGATEALRHIEQGIRAGKHWYIALLEAIGLWQCPHEEYRGREWHYLIAGQAFDWLLLAQRLCESVDVPLPQAETTALLFHGTPPLELTVGQFRELIGGGKYRMYLNYFYGITVEEAVALAVQDEVRKERTVWGCNGEHTISDEVHRRVYGYSRGELLRDFRRECGNPETDVISLTELKEFSYWLFNFRLKCSEKARIASDTRKGLEWLRSHGVVGMVG